MNQQTLKSRNYEGWNTNSHLRTFEFWNALSNRSFNFMYGSFQENKYLIELIKKRKAKSVVDIGCATGTTYKLLRNFVGERNFEYNGFDISEPAVAQALRLHKKSGLMSEKKHIGELKKIRKIHFQRENYNVKNLLFDLVWVCRMFLHENIKMRYFLIRDKYENFRNPS